MRGSSRIFPTFFTALALVVAFSESGCRQKELYLPEEIHPEVENTIVEIEFLWTKAENAMVEGMSTYFFPLSQGGKIWSFEIAGMHGGPVALFPGDYSLVAVNNDLPGVDLSADLTASSATVNARYNNDGSLRPSGMIYGSIIDNAQVTSDPCQTISVTPDSLATVYNILLKDIRQQEDIESIYACLSGVAVSLTISGRHTSMESACINIPIDMVSGTMSGSVTGLGTPSGSPHFELTLYATLTDKRRIAKSLTFDITDQVVGAKYPRNVFIILQGIDFHGEEPDTPDDGEDVGMDVAIDGWSHISIDLITGL